MAAMPPHPLLSQPGEDPDYELRAISKGLAPDPKADGHDGDDYETSHVRQSMPGPDQADYPSQAPALPALRLWLLATG